MTQIRMGDAINALATAFAAWPALAGVLVETGPHPSSGNDQSYIVVGHDGSLAADGSLSPVTVSGSFTIPFVAMGGAGAELEQDQGVINCIAVAQSGDQESLPAQITAAQQLAQACGDACIDLKVSGIVFDHPAAGRALTRNVAAGCVAIMLFTVTYSAPW